MNKNSKHFYESSDDEIVYGTQTQPREPLGFGGGLLSMTQESQCSHPVATTVSTNRCRRHYFKKRQQQKHEHQQQHDSSADENDNSNTNSNNDDSEEEKPQLLKSTDDFDALAEFLNREPEPPAKRQNVAEPVGPLREPLEERDYTLMSNSTQIDFPMHHDDDEDENNFATSTRNASAVEPALTGSEYTTKISRTPYNQSGSTLLDIAAMRQVKTKKKSPSSTAIDFQASLVSQLEKSRKRSRKEDVWSARLGGASTKNMRTAAVIEPPRKITEKTSTVATRPNHWDDHSSRTMRSAYSISQTTRTTSNRMHDMTARSRKLSEATKCSSLSAINPAPNSTRKDPTIANTNTTTVTPPIFTFAPAFLVNSKPSNDAVEEPTQSLAEPPPCSSPKVRNKTRVRVGPLLQTLRKVRSAVDSDMVRFQSGMYPPGKKDCQDPRQRASSRLYVTIVGTPVPWGIHEEKLTVLASLGEDCTQSSSRLAHVTFTYATARTQRLTPGSKLVIYNPVVVPGTPSLVLATQLCEAC